VRLNDSGCIVDHAFPQSKGAVPRGGHKRENAMFIDGFRVTDIYIRLASEAFRRPSLVFG